MSLAGDTGAAQWLRSTTITLGVAIDVHVGVTVCVGVVSTTLVAIGTVSIVTFTPRRGTAREAFTMTGAVPFSTGALEGGLVAARGQNDREEKSYRGKRSE
jgi:hypothetical protein